MDPSRDVKFATLNLSTIQILDESNFAKEKNKLYHTRTHTEIMALCDTFVQIRFPRGLR